MSALYRAIGSAELMAEQCARLTEVARLDAVTLQVVPPVRIPLATVSLILADNAAAYTENAVSGLCTPTYSSSDGGQCVEAYPA
jgi:hypothetical protein